MTYRRIGIIGAGLIGKAIYDEVLRCEQAEVTYVLASRAGNAQRRVPEWLGLGLCVYDLEEALARPVDVVFEAAHADVLASIAPRVLASSDLCGFSCTALARPDVERAITENCLANGTRFFLPHGAILGLDGLVDGRECIEDVTITTTKSAAGLGQQGDAHGVVFEGTARDACRKFPRNVNVHAAIAIAGIGFDRTKSIVVAKPGTDEMHHRIQVSGQGFAWDFSVASHSLGGVTGAYTPKSAAGSVRRILASKGIVNC
ncbi:aspartate dehydrogenase domain-containing protein [Bradyrhizobium iriomotense]|uniref:L-aspartate dehydrogenase 1 n=1 Tax=Bradyrhizobium iriomotense TaxID=441950 RepID=A0ABQ6BBS1_9BRAD|nr:aspartate dehydrogenase domain-containing protein [Bradyrhizobium iriomotense]GLR91842.1 putative L-aspartate dehydrogenase 1 [Bradyrhizobium iriomotense]